MGTVTPFWGKLKFQNKSEKERKEDRKGKEERMKMRKKNMDRTIDKENKLP